MSLEKSSRVLLAVEPPEDAESTWEQVVVSLGRQDPAIDVTFLSFRPESVHPVPRRADDEKIIKLTVGKLLSTPKTLSALQSFREFSEHHSFQQFRYVALKLLNRKDLTGTLRFLEREVLLTGAISGVIDVLRDQKPDLIVFGVTPHEFVQFVVWSVAKWMGTRVLFFQPSPVAPVMLARTNLNEIFSPKPAVVSESAVSEHALTTAEQRIALLCDGLDPKYMEIQRQRDQTVTRIRHKITALRVSLGWLFTDRFPESIDFSGHSHRHGLFTRALKILLVRSLSSTLRTTVLALRREREIPKKYCVFALHYEPERTSLPEGLPIDFQGDAVILARTLTPDYVTLVVKEHYSQQTSALRGFVGRSPLFYELVESFPNSVFADTKDRLSELVAEAQCVFTLTGSVAIEAVLRGVPVVYFGSPWWGGMPGTLRYDKSITFEDVIGQQMPSQDEVAAFLADLTLNRMIPGVASEPIRTVEERLGPLPAVFLAAEAKSITVCITELLRA